MISSRHYVRFRAGCGSTLSDRAFTAIVGGLILLVNMGPGMSISIRPIFTYSTSDLNTRWSFRGREEKDILDIETTLVVRIYASTCPSAPRHDKLDTLFVFCSQSTLSPKPWVSVFRLTTEMEKIGLSGWIVKGQVKSQRFSDWVLNRRGMSGGAGLWKS